MPSKKKKYNARFPAGRIKKIMQTDEEVGKVAQAVPIIISRTLELFVESLLMKSIEITNKKNVKTLSPSHMKQCILSESRFDFLRELVKNIPDAHADEKETVQPSSADGSPNRHSDGGAPVNPGPSNPMKRPRRPYTRRDNGQSSDSGSDHEPVFKRNANKIYGNGRNLPKADFEEDLKAYQQIKKNIRSDADSEKFAVPNEAPAVSGESSNAGKQRLFNFYAETLPDTSEDDEKEKANRISSVIQANPEYSGSFGFYKPANIEDADDGRGKKSVEMQAPKPKVNPVPTLRIDLTQGVFTPASISVIMNDEKRSPSCPRTPTTPLLSRTGKKAPPPLQTISLKRSTSAPEGRMFIRPANTASTSAVRKNEPPSLLPINVVQKTILRPPPPEIDEDYDT